MTSLAGQALPGPSYARLAQARERGHVALTQAAGDATTDVRVLVLASHPDDRWVLPAAWFRFQQHWRVDTLLLTRGEGGQNITGPETGDVLGAIRTLEAELAAARVDTELHYLNRQDAGFCRTAGEALELWGRTRTVNDLARMLRLLRPDLIVTTHHAAETHGHDLALLRLIPEAVALATDSEHATPGLPPLRAPRIFVGAAPDEIPTVTIDLDQVDPVRGDTIRRLAYAAHLEHHSQRPIPPIDEVFERELRLLRLDHGRSSDPLFGGWPSVESALGTDAETARALASRILALPVHVASPSKLLLQALELRADIAALPASDDRDLQLRREARLAALERIVQHAGAIALRVEPASDVAVPGTALPLRVHVDLGGSEGLEQVRLHAPEGARLQPVEPADPGPFLIPRRGRLVLDQLLHLPAGLPTMSERVRSMYQERRFRWPVALSLSAKLQGQELQFELPVGVDLLPRVELAATPRTLLLPRGDEDVRLAIEVRRHVAQPIDGMLRVLAPAGFLVTPAHVPVAMTHERAITVPFELRTPPGLRPGVYSVVVELAGTRISVPLHKVDVGFQPALRVGLVKGVDDTAEGVLAGLGAEVVPLRDEDLSLRPLDEFDVIVCDVRSLRLREAARASFPRLLAFAAAGGRLVVFYHKDVEFNFEQAGFRGAPFELLVGKGRVTRADAPVRVLQPEHVLLTTPNRIRAEDWDGWHQERGLYFAERYDDAYEELLAMSDPNQDEERGALLYARYGKGEYVYCALSLWRQLKNLHPGACRLFANLVQRPL